MPDLAAWVPAIDISYANLATLTPDFHELSPNQMVIQCLSTGREQPPTRTTNLRLCQSANIPTAGYISIVPNQTASAAIGLGVNGLPYDLLQSLRVVAVDVEIAGVSYGEVEAMTVLLRTMNLKTCIYTRRLFWLDNIHPTLHPPETPLWLASWRQTWQNGYSELPFAGWKPEDLIGIQYEGASNVGSIEADLNFIDPAFWGLTAPPPNGNPPDPTEPLRLELEAIAEHAQRARDILSPPH